MKVTPTEIPDVLLFEPQVFGDHPGFFFESFNQQAFTDKTGLTCQFVQDNHSLSQQNILRGLHYQIQQPVVIGDHCYLEHCFVGPYSSIADGARLVDIELDHSVVLQNATIEGIHQRIVDS
jgi:NDP-sugar pyrophosphorylase family protein